MERPTKRMKKVIEGLLDFQSYHVVSFRKCFTQTILDLINKESSNQDTITMDIFNIESSHQSHQGYQKHNVMINIAQHNNVNYLMVYVKPEDDTIFRVNHEMKFEDLLKKEFDYYREKIKETHSFKKLLPLEETINKNKLTYVYAFESEIDFNIDFFAFITKVLKDVKIQKKSTINNEEDFKFLYSLFGRDYISQPHNKTKEIIELMDIRLGSLTKESRDLIELNNSF